VKGDRVSIALPPEKEQAGCVSIIDKFKQTLTVTMLLEDGNDGIQLEVSANQLIIPIEGKCNT
jgi:hypothetical protein